jgi:HlyD family secretion protein
MIKYIVITTCSVLVVGSLAMFDQRSDKSSPATAESMADVPGRTAFERGEPTRIFASGIVEGKTEDVELRPEASGRVEEVLVRLGDWVNAGDVLLRLDDRSQRAQVAVSLANLQLAEANLERLVNGARDTERQEARAMLAAKKARLNQARLTWQRVQTLRAQAAIAQQEADDQEGVLLALTAEVEAAEARLEQLAAPAREDELRAAQARVAAAQADYELTTIALDRTSLKAPTRAQVLDVGVEPGETITPERAQPVIVLADTSQLRVRAFVEEIDAPRVRVGATAEVSADGLMGRSYTAVVRTIGPRMKAKTISSERPEELYDSKIREVLLDVTAERFSDLLVGLRVDVELAVVQQGPRDSQVTGSPPRVEVRQ